MEEFSTSAEDEQLVLEISKHPELYDPQNKKYKLHKAKEIIWKRIAARLNKSESGAGGFLNNTTINANTPNRIKKDGNRRAQSLVPMCARQINQLEGDSDFYLFHIKINMVYFVGMVTEIELTSTKIHYTLEDHTGTIKAVWWLEATEPGEESTNTPEAKERSYVQLFGTIKKQDGEKVLMVLKMFLVEDANIITTHLLEVIHTRIQSAKTPVVAKLAGSELRKSLAFIDEQPTQFTTVQQKVLDILRADLTETGASTTAIVKHFQPNQKSEAQEALEFLINEGHAYSTVDNDHFKATTDA